jgi:hypothetical protein
LIAKSISAEAEVESVSYATASLGPVPGYAYMLSMGAAKVKALWPALLPAIFAVLSAAEGSADRALGSALGAGWRTGN